MTVIFFAFGKFVTMEFFQVLLALEPFPTRPAFTDLLQKGIPLGFVSMTSRRVSSEITKGIVRHGPSFKVPGPWLSVRAADLQAILFHERTDSRMAVHGLDHVQAGAIQSDER